jgi:hypothetical protein
MQRRKELKTGFVIYIIAAAIAWLSPFSDLSAQKRDTSFVSVSGGTPVRVKKWKSKEDVFHSPRKAALYSAVLPGLGQIYNRKYWKVPIVYAGYGTLGYFVYFNSTHYVTYRDAYIDFTDENPGTTSYFNIISDAIDPSTYDKELYPERYNQSDYDWMKQQLKDYMDFYKRNRDLSLIGIAGWYILTILDSVVDAQLFHFDIDPDLSLRVIPAVRPMPGMQPAGGITCSITF